MIARPQCVQAVTCIVRTAGADRVGEDGDLQLGIKCIEGGLIYADGGLQSANDQMLDIHRADLVTNAIIGHGRKVRFAELHGLRGELEELGQRAAEFLRYLFGEYHGHAETLCRLNGETAAPDQLLAVGDRFQKNRL